MIYGLLNKNKNDGKQFYENKRTNNEDSYLQQQHLQLKVDDDDPALEEYLLTSGHFGVDTRRIF